MDKQQRRTELKARILKAAGNVFTQKGYAEAKIADIAREAYVSPSTIYIYFSGKRELFDALDLPELEALRPEFDRRRQEITRVALSLFGSRGFEGTTMDAIAEDAGFSKAALYQYCTSKEDLFLQVLKLYTHAIPPAEDSILPDGDDWKQGIQNIARTFMEAAHDPERSAFLGSVIRDSNQFPDFGRVYYEQSFCTARNNTEQLLLRARQEGNVRQDVDLRLAVTAFLCSLIAYNILYDIVGGISRDVDEKSYVEMVAEQLIRSVEK